VGTLASQISSWIGYENIFLTEMDPNAIDYALGHFDPYDLSDPYGQGDPYRAYNFIIGVFETDKFTEYLRDITHWMAFPVTIESTDDFVAWPNTPSVVPAYGTYNHWIVVNGASTSQDPYANLDSTVYGLWLTDPASGGIGQDLYVTAQTAQDTYFKVVTSDDQHNGKFLHVSEPPAEESEAEVEMAEPEVNDQTLKAIEIASNITEDIPDNLSPFEERLESAKRHIYDAALVVNLGSDSKISRDTLVDEQSGDLLNLVFGIDNQAPIELDWRKIVDFSLLSDEDFRQAFDGSQARSFIKVRRTDKENCFYYLIPFDKYVQGQFLTCVAIIINAEDGSFQEASWVEESTRFIQVTREEAVALVLSENPHLESEELNIELIWEPGAVSPSPFYPYWRISSGSEVYYRK
ncbi:hypothetical protein KA005_34880, partial [bacterium]|nr:hypothetical protein [bacterium]